MNVALVSAVWQRHALARVWWAGVRRIQERFAQHGITMSVTVAGSEPAHRRLARTHGTTWVECENWPLGRKWNAAAESACHSGADYLLILGSDDFLSDGIVDRYAELLGDGWLYLGLAGIYFYEPATQRLARYDLCHGSHGSPVGAGRLVHRSLLERVGYRPWLDCLNRCLDGDMRKRCDLPPAKLLHVGPSLVALDVKTDTNIWTFDRLAEGYAVLESVSESRLDLPEWGALVALGTQERKVAA